MKGRIFIAIILIIAAAILGRQMSGRDGAGHGAGREQTRQTYALEADAAVEVRGINGSVEISTAETDRAEVTIIRTAESADDLESRRVIIEHSPSRLVIRGEDKRQSWWRRLCGDGNVRQQIILIVPRRVELEARGVNGPVRIGEVDGSVSVAGVNGRVEVEQAAGRSEVRGVNGSVKFTVTRLGSDGMDVKGVNGSVEIRLTENLNADINIRGLNGNLRLDVPNVTAEERENRSNMRARLGAGGSPINVTGVNGNVRFESSAPAAPATPVIPNAPLPPAPPASDDN